MTNEDAIKMLNTLYSTDVYINDALDLAIKALETGEVYMTGEDYNLYMEGYKADKKEFEPKQGEWIEKQETPASVSYYCSNCKMSDLPFMPYCPWCGAKMKGGAENG